MDRTAADLQLRDPPKSRDRYGRPAYPIRQAKGLAQVTSHELTRRSTQEGYTAAVDRQLNAAIRSEVAQIGAAAPVDVLEIGGGSGWTFDLLEPYVRSYVNVEPSDVDLDAAGVERLRGPRYTSIQCSAEDLPLADASFDLVLSLASLDHIPDHRAAVSEIARSLRPSGHFMLELNNKGSWWKRALAGTELLRRREALIAREHYIQWTLEQCVAMLSEHFDVVRARTLTFFPHVPVIWRAALPVADLVGPWLVPGRGGNMLVLCRKGGTAL